MFFYKYLDRNLIRGKINKFFEIPIIKILKLIKIKPNHISIFGLILAFISSYFISNSNFIFSPLFLLLSGVCDLLDGSLARYTQSVTKFGGVLDSVLDRFGEAAIFIGIFIYFTNYDSIVPNIFVLMALSSSTVVTYLRSKAEILGISCDIGIMTRTERVLILFLALILTNFFDFILLISIIVIFILSLFTIFQRMRHINNSINS